MVGLSVVLEPHNNYTPTSTLTTKKTVMPLVICKPTVVKPPPSSTLASPSSTGWRPVGGGGFLDACSLCGQSLLPGKDIYMYKGDKAFCSEECRWKQMLMDDSDEQNRTTTTTTTTTTTSRRKEAVRGNYKYNDNCSLAARVRHHRNPFSR